MWWHGYIRDGGYTYWRFLGSFILLTTSRSDTYWRHTFRSFICWPTCGCTCWWTTYWLTTCYGGATLACRNNQILGASSMPTHQSSKGSTQFSGGVELRRCFSNEGGFEMILSIRKDTIGFKNSTFDVGQSNNGGSKVDQCWFGAMHVANFDIDGWVRKNSGG